MLVLCFYKPVRETVQYMEELFENTRNEDGLPSYKREDHDNVLRSRGHCFMRCFSHRS